MNLDLERSLNMIDTLTLSIGGKKVTLSLKEAKELHAKLDELFGRTPVWINPTIPVAPIRDENPPVYPYPGPTCVPTWERLPDFPKVICQG